MAGATPGVRARSKKGRQGGVRGVRAGDRHGAPWQPEVRDGGDDGPMDYMIWTCTLWWRALDILGAQFSLSP
jgi:hypothetical protein